jgi:hypothetical protein
MSGRGRVKVISVEQWPRPERFRWVRDPSSGSVPTVTHSGSETEWHVLGIAGENDEVTTRLDEDGTPLALSDWDRGLTRRGGPVYAFGPRRYRSVTVPLWMPLALGGVAPAVVFGRRIRRSGLRRRRAALRLCVQCGYDLRGSPECCPECGATPASAVKE